MIVYCCECKFEMEVSDEAFKRVKEDMAKLNAPIEKAEFICELCLIDPKQMTKQ